VGKLLAEEAELGMGTVVGTLVCVEPPAPKEEIVAEAVELPVPEEEVVAEVVELDRSEDEADAESALSSR
jgi:hypothetical protein